MSHAAGLDELCARFGGDRLTADAVRYIGGQLIAQLERGEQTPLVDTHVLADGRWLSVSLSVDGEWEACVGDVGGLLRKVRAP
jgi:hypothetical protein